MACGVFAGLVGPLARAAALKCVKMAAKTASGGCSRPALKQHIFIYTENSTFAADGGLGLQGSWSPAGR